MKMFEYFAFGIPVITTAYGARGISVTPKKDCIVTEKGHYAEDIRKFCGMSLQERNCIAENALKLLIDQYSWRSLGRRVAEEIEAMYDISISNSALSLEKIKLYDFEGTEPCLPSKAFYIRCAGEYGRNCFAYLRGKGLKPKAFVDEDKEKQKSGVEGIPVISLAQFVEERENEQVIIAVFPTKILDITAEMAACDVNFSDLFMAWDESGARIMRLSDLEGCRPHYYDAAKWRREIMESAAYIRECGRAIDESR